jgi:hypothetical protein
MIEDGQGAMTMFRRIREEYEKAVRMGHLHGIRPKVEESEIPSRQISNEGSTKWIRIASTRRFLFNFDHTIDPDLRV